MMPNDKYLYGTTLFAIGCDGKLYTYKCERGSLLHHADWYRLTKANRTAPGVLDSQLVEGRVFPKRAIKVFSERKSALNIVESWAEELLAECRERHDLPIVLINEELPQ